MDNTNTNPLSRNYTLCSLLKFTFPTIAMMIFMGVYTLTDTIFVSRFVNTDALSAINIVCPVINIIVGLGTMLATGGSAIVARKMGLGEIKRAKQDFTLLVILGILIGFIIAILGALFIDEIIWGLKASKVLFLYCKEYLLLLFLFTPASILQTLFQSLLVTAGKPTLGLLLSVGAGIANIVLDYICIVILDMGIMGAALGTGIGYMIPAVFGILFFSKQKHRLSFVKPIFDISVIKESCINGSSEMVSQISTAVTTFFFNLTMMKLLAENGVAAITIIIYTQFLMTTLYIGFSMGVAPIISFNYGAKNTERLKKVYKMCLKMIAVSSIVIFSIAIFGGNQLVGLFTKPGTNVYEIATNGFMLFSFSFLFSGANIFSSATFTALSNGKTSAIISFFRTFGFIMIGLLILPKYLHVTGVWLAVPIAELLTFGMSLGFILYYKSRYKYL